MRISLFQDRQSWRSPLAVGVQTLRNLFDWSPSTIKETQHEAMRNPAVSPQLQSPVTVQPIKSSVISSEQCIGHPMQRDLFVSPERSNIEHRQRPMIKHDEVEIPPMLAQSKLPQPKTVVEIWTGTSGKFRFLKWSGVGSSVEIWTGCSGGDCWCGTSVKVRSR